MTIWKAHLIRENLVQKSKEMGLRLPQMQMLLAQERFLARLFSVEEGRFFVWKGGSLFIREYSLLKVPRYTVDIDLLLKGTDYQNLQQILEKVCAQQLNDGFVFQKSLQLQWKEKLLTAVIVLKYNGIFLKSHNLKH